MSFGGPLSTASSSDVWLISIVSYLQSMLDSTQYLSSQNNRFLYYLVPEINHRPAPVDDQPSDDDQDKMH